MQLDGEHISVGVSSEEHALVCVEGPPLLLQEVDQNVVVLDREHFWHRRAAVLSQNVLAVMLVEHQRVVSHDEDAPQLGLAQRNHDEPGFCFLGHWVRRRVRYWMSCLSLSLSARILAWS